MDSDEVEIDYGRQPWKVFSTVVPKDFQESNPSQGDLAVEAICWAASTMLPDVTGTGRKALIAVDFDFLTWIQSGGPGGGARFAAAGKFMNFMQDDFKLRPHRVAEVNPAGQGPVNCYVLACYVALSEKLDAKKQKKKQQKKKKKQKDTASSSKDPASSPEQGDGDHDMSA